MKVDHRKLPRAKRSVIWSISSDELRSIVEKSRTTSEVLLHFGLQNKGGNYRTLRNRLQAEGITYDHFDHGYGSVIRNPYRGRSVTEYIAQRLSGDSKSRTKNVTIKKKLIDGGILKEECILCGTGPTWNGKPLSLQLDHINGINTDNRLENLRLLCPNCHSQTHTYAGRGIRTKVIPVWCSGSTAGLEPAESGSKPFTGATAP